MAEQTADTGSRRRAREYARAARRALAAELLVGFGFLLAVLLSGASEGLSGILDLPHPAGVAAYTVVLAVGYTVITTTLTYYSGYVLPHRFGMSHQDLKSWLTDRAKETAVAGSLGLGLVVAVYQVMLVSPDLWWLWASVLMVLVMVVLTGLGPVVILPLFFQTKPLADSEVRDRLLNLARRSGTRVADIREVGLDEKTPAGNAMLMGWGRTRRIAISDTVLSAYAPDEIEVIMAHELGHDRHGDVGKMMAAQALFILLALYLSHVALKWSWPGLGLDAQWDIAGLPLIALVAGATGLAFMPLSNTLSRHLELSADRYSLQMTENPRAFASMLSRLTEQNLAESEPPRWVETLLHDHPPPYRRLKLAESHKASKEPT